MDNQIIYSKIKQVIKLILLFGFAQSLQAQKHFDYNWLFGYGTGEPDSSNPFGGIKMLFDNKQISFIPQAREFEFNCQTNSFSNESGELLLMSNGCFIADSNGNKLFEGDSIGYGKIWGVNCPKYQPLFQAGIFLNFSNQKDTIVFLHIILDTIGNGLKVFLKCLYETKIDINQNKVISKNKIILYDTLYGGGLTSIPNSDFSKWWVIVPRDQSNEIYTFLYTKSGIEKILKQSLGLKHDPLGSGGAQGVFSPNGKHYAFYSPLNGLQVFDFDRFTGELSNFKFYNINFSVNTLGGCGFSPDSRFVYVSNPTEVLQVDLMEQDMLKAIDTVGVFDNFFDPYPATYMQMALGPDCRIYITAGGGNRYLHVIMNPNRKGKECNLINRGLKLPTRNSHATTNFPHYRVDDPYPCDSTISIPLNTDVDNEIKFRKGDIFIYPNPVANEMHIHDIHGIINDGVQIKIVDLNGSVLYTNEFENLLEEQTISLHTISSGMYFIYIMDLKGNIWVDKFMKY